jgi:hypothetical protein
VQIEETLTYGVIKKTMKKKKKKKKKKESCGSRRHLCPCGHKCHADRSLP